MMSCFPTTGSLIPAKKFLGCVPLRVAVHLLFWALLAQCFQCFLANVGGILTHTSNHASGMAHMLTSIETCTGIPLLIAALWGAHTNREPFVRLGLYYLWMRVGIDTLFLVDILVVRDVCERMDAVGKAPQSGAAFTCGIMRSLNCLALAALVVATIYFAYIVWSYCEELQEGGAAAKIASFLAAIDDKLHLQEAGAASKQELTPYAWSSACVSYDASRFKGWNP
mmetsp:Transcript_64099/g.134766  ORF Transcript_64099/g.134766 Transcript_64099/m.134766 type:complete len:225 (-) Transcript_64099:331-1005(-)